MSAKQEEKLLFKALLPKRLKIKLHKAKEGGYWTKVVEIPCYSQGENLAELFEVLTKAIYAYYDVPQKFIHELGSYIPASSVRKEVHKRKPAKYTLDEILGGHPERIHELEMIA